MEGKRNCHCSGKANRMGRFLEASLLLLLKNESAHGYGLMDRLEDQGFDMEDLNAGSLYRTLRKMEQQGQVLSKWEEGDGGPKKRVYAITKRGEEELEQWYQVFQERATRIQRFLEVYERDLPELKGKQQSSHDTSNQR